MEADKKTEPYFNKLVEVYFGFCRSKFNENPSFDGSAPRDLKSIASSLRIRAEKIGVEWTEIEAIKRFCAFLNFAWMDLWLSKNWILSNLNRQKDKIFFNIKIAKQQEYIDPFV